MNEQKKAATEFLKNTGYSVGSNLFSLCISVITVFILPKLVGVEPYGYYQLYLFYLGYVSLPYFGWCEGIYLRLGGQYYENVDKPLYCTQFWVFGVYHVILYLIVALAAVGLTDSADRLFVIICVCVVAVAKCWNWFFSSLMQSTARVKEFSVATIVERATFVTLMAALLFLDYRDYKLIVCADMAAKFLSIFLCIWYCRDVIFSRFHLDAYVVSEIRENIRAGIKLTLATLCSTLIIGVVRFGVQDHWDIATFSKVSLTLSISNIAMTAINAISVVVYPALRRAGTEHLPEIYKVMRVILMGLVFGALIFYYPLQCVLTVWLPQYAESIRYAAILFPICAYESKMSLLINTYFKTLRMETLLMKCNIVALVFSVLCTLVATLVLNSVTAAILAILVVLVFRCVISEMVLSKYTPILVNTDIMIELFMSLAFIICNWYFGLLGMALYALLYGGYLLIKKKDILHSIAFVKSLK